MRTTRRSRKNPLYGDHLASAGSVNGASITKDEWNRQMAVNGFRADYQQRRLRTLLDVFR